MPRNYEPEFKKKIVRLHIEQGQTYKSITEEYDVPFALLQKITERITSEVTGINRVLYDLTPKPSGTIEWE